MMTRFTEQMEQWVGQFGRDYTDRNALSLDEMEALYLANYGHTRTELNEDFLSGIGRSVRILEVGSNIGNQLVCLESMGFDNLHGIELQTYAVELASRRAPQINVVQGSAFGIPFGEDCFDLVFTSGVLIHISQSDIDLVMREIHRCSRAFIWGFEYWADRYTEILYRGHKDLLWKADFAKLYLDRFSDLEMMKERRVKYLDSNNVDSMFLLRKR